MKRFFLFVVLALPVFADVPVPRPATQTEVNAGVLTQPYISPATLGGWTGGSGNFSYITNSMLSSGATNQSDINGTWLPTNNIYYFNNYSNLFISGYWTMVKGGQVYYNNTTLNGQYSDIVGPSPAPFVTLNVTTNNNLIGVIFGNGGGLTNLPMSSIATNGVTAVITNNVYCKIPWFTNAQGTTVYMLGFTNGP